MKVNRVWFYIENEGEILSSEINPMKLIILVIYKYERGWNVGECRYRQRVTLHAQTPFQNQCALSPVCLSICRAFPSSSLCGVVCIPEFRFHTVRSFVYQSVTLLANPVPLTLFPSAYLASVISLRVLSPTTTFLVHVPLCRPVTVQLHQIQLKLPQYFSFMSSVLPGRRSPQWFLNPNCPKHFSFEEHVLLIVKWIPEQHQDINGISIANKSLVSCYTLEESIALSTITHGIKDLSVNVSLRY